MKDTTKTGLTEAERNALDVFESIGRFMALVGTDISEMDFCCFPEDPDTWTTPAEAAANPDCDCGECEAHDEPGEHEARKDALMLTIRCIEWLTDYADALTEALPPKKVMEVYEDFHARH